MNQRPLREDERTAIQVLISNQICPKELRAKFKMDRLNRELRDMKFDGKLSALAFKRRIVALKKK